MTRSRFKVVVIGGGAAGFFGAITCAETHPHTEVTVLEANREVLTKVRISGGGRCNVTHACFDPAQLIGHYPRGNKALRGPFSRFQPQDTVKWFEQRGVQVKMESDGRMFPTTDDSATIIDCLMTHAQQAGVRIQTEATALALDPPEPSQDPTFKVHLKRGGPLHAHRILLASGSHRQGYRLAATVGHVIEDPVPSLFTFNIKDPDFTDLAGISVNTVHLKLQIPDSLPLQQTGSVLITHWGVSGPAVLKLSAWGARALYNAKYQATLWANWIPDITQEQARQLLQTQQSEATKKLLRSHNPFRLPQRLWQYLIEQAGVDPEGRWAGLSKKGINQLVQQLTRSTFQVRGKGVFKEEFVTCGGIRLKDVNFKSMESRLCPGLFFAGEILDIDGVTGGFNFQNAWTTAWLAGQAMGNSDVKRE